MGTQPNAAAIAAARASHKNWGIPASISLPTGARKRLGEAHERPAQLLRHEALLGQLATVVTTHEVYKGVRVQVQQSFRAFSSDEEAFDAHGKLLATDKAYAKARAKLPGPFAFGSALTGVYATDPAYALLV